eukprot:GHVU01207428.1.p1 GENE.GHVU01207428.1~~GHVU01207428.1.p1  ORF type:complete len:126 (+),score=8.02 GHVU01207428.1:78-455(+)
MADHIYNAAKPKTIIYHHSRYCSAIKCHNSRSKNPQLSFYSFPNAEKDTSRCERWVQNSRREELKLNDLDSVKHLLLCEEHFEASQFMCPAEKGVSKPKKDLGEMLYLHCLTYRTPHLKLHQGDQ